MRVAVRTAGAVLFSLALCLCATAVAVAAQEQAQSQGKPNLGAKPPQGAVVLFDGSDVSKWVTRKGGEPAKWKIKDGAMVAGGGDIDTKEQFRDFDLHVEWRTPEPKPGQKGQGRGNSGVYMLGTYEVQVLESYGLEPLVDGAGAIYNQKAADVNAALPPMEWQSYDITFRGPRFDESGKRTEKARVTVVWNGKKVHDNVEIDGPTRAGNAEETATGPIRLQDHGHPVEFRNIWLVPAKDSKEVTGARSNAVSLFNGKDLAGWKQAGPGKFEVQDGTLVTVGGMGMLWHEREMPEKFTLSMEFKTGRKEDNSGVFVRFPNPGDDPWVAIKQGYEIQICEGNEKQFTGSIYNLKMRDVDGAALPPGQWNEYEIAVDGQKMTVRLNGKKINEYTGDRTTKTGHIGIQNHDPKSKVSFRNIRVIDNTGAGDADAKKAQAKPAAKKAQANPAASGAGVKPQASGDAKARSGAIELPAPAPVDEARVAGLVGKYFKDVKNLDALDEVKDGSPFLVRVDDRVAFGAAKGQFHKTKLATEFGATWTGYLRVKQPGARTIALRSDDDSKLYVGDTLVIHHKLNPDTVMKDQAREVTFPAAGDYPIRIEYHNAGGPGGMQLTWKGKDDKFEPVPAAHFVHDARQAKVEWDQAAWNKATWSYREWAQKHGQNYERMDYGPFLGATIEVGEKNHALKGYAIHLGDQQEATIVFDTDLLRFAGGWTGGFLELTGVVFDGAHGTNPRPDGEFVFQAPQLPGAIAGDYSAKLATDPRPRPYGPLPREWAKYKGLHLHGDRVVLHYTVGGVDVWDAPWAKGAGDDVIITRSIKLAPSDQPTTLLLDKPTADLKAEVVTSGGVEVKQQGENRYLVFPPRKEATTYAVAISRAGKRAEAVADNVDDLLKAGPARWTERVVTKGQVSTSTTQPYVLDTITVPEQNPYQSWMRFGGLDFFPDGRAAVSTWSGDVWVVSGIDDKLDKLEWKRFATGLFQPLGLKIVGDQIYVLGRDQITRFTDANKDGEADLYENFNNDCEVSRSFHEFSFDLQTDPQGNFYFAKAGPVRPGGRGWEEITAHNGAILRVSKDGQKFETFATGVRAPNGMSVGPNGEVTVADNEGTWTPTCRLSFVKPNDFLGVVDLAHREPAPKDYEKPICWLPHGEVDNSSGGQVWVTSDKWGPFTNRLLHTSYGKCSLMLVMSEEVDGQVQGGVVQFPKLDFITGICRPRFHPVDKQLYVAGLRGWQTSAARDAGLQRVRYTGAAVKMPTALKVLPDGVAITFTTPLDEKAALDLGNYAVEQWNYLWSSEYGSAEYSVIEPKEKGHDGVEVEKVTLSPDKKTVTLKLEEVIPVMQMKIQMKLKSADGSPLEFSVYNTINKVPGGGSKDGTAAAARE